MASSVFSQTKTTEKSIHKIHISHADPALIAMLLSGKNHDFLISPEHSTVDKLNNKK